MYCHIKKLHEISSKAERTIIGLMSGTSLDGLDIALCKIRGNGRDTKVEIVAFVTKPYNDEFRQEVKKIFSVKKGDIELLVLLNTFIGKMHGQMVVDVLNSWKIKTQNIDAIASHGQTIYHAPKSLHQRPVYENATLQIGDGDQIAVTTGIITISDFRMKHIAAGGEGAPLAVYGDYLLFSDYYENRIMLNIGGIANFTWLPNKDTELQRPCFSTDVGPGNTIMDAYVQKHKDGFNYDKDATFASLGQVNNSLLNALYDHHFFKMEIPKTIGPELFNLEYLESAIKKVNELISQNDILATLNKFSADAIVNVIKKYVPREIPFSIYPSGGGVHNPLLMFHIKTALPQADIKDIGTLNVSGDAKEAVLFALLANECLSGNTIDISRVQNVVPNISMGKICLPG
jgi:anhydro-N-acetylmuramic acid kinase